MLKKLFEGVDGLTDELIARMQPMFEAAVDQKSQATITQLKEAHNAELEELREQLAESAAVNNEERARLMAEKLDVFLERVVGSWINENSEKVQGVAINEAAAVFLGQLAEAAKAFNVVIPESDQSIVESLNDKIQKLEGRLNDTIRENVSLRESEIKTKKLVIAGRVAKGMSEVGKSRLKEAALGSTYRDAKQFKALVESHRSIIEGEKDVKDQVDEDDLFDDGKVKKSKQKPDGTMGEDFVDGTDKSYPLNIQENDDEDEDDFFDDEDEMDESKKGKKGKKGKLKENDDEDDDDEDEDGDEDEKEKKGVNESVDMSVFKSLVRTKR